MKHLFKTALLVLLAVTLHASAQQARPAPLPADARASAARMAAALDERVQAIGSVPPPVMQLCERAKSAVATLERIPAQQQDAVQAQQQVARHAFTRAAIALAELEFTAEHTPEALRAITAAGVKRLRSRVAALRERTSEPLPELEEVDSDLAAAQLALEEGTAEEAHASLEEARDGLLDVEEKLAP